MKFIKLTNDQRATVDDNMFELLNAKKWAAKYDGHNFYARRTEKFPPKQQRTEYLHWYVIGKPIPKYSIDHINRNTLDNRLSNLRIVIHGMNNANRKSMGRGGLVGAHKHIKKGSILWTSRIYINGKYKNLGSFKTEKAAHRAFMKAHLEEKGWEFPVSGGGQP